MLSSKVILGAEKLCPLKDNYAIIKEEKTFDSRNAERHRENARN